MDRIPHGPLKTPRDGVVVLRSLGYEVKWSPLGILVKISWRT